MLAIATLATAASLLAAFVGDVIWGNERREIKSQTKAIHRKISR